MGDDSRNYKFVSDPVDLEDNVQGSLSLSTSAAQTDTLPLGVYDVWTDADCYIKVGPTATNVTAANGYVLYVNNVVPVIVRKNRRIGGITASGTATLYYHKVG